MKKPIILICLVLNSFLTFSQTSDFQILLDKYDKLKHENDSLKKTIVNEKVKFELKSKAIYDSVSTVSAEINLLKTKLSKLESENHGLINQIVKFDKKNLANLESKIKRNEDSIISLNKALVLRDKKNIELSSNSHQNEKTKFLEGRNSILIELAKVYETQKIDDLILFFTKEKVNKDIEILKLFPIARQNMLYLKYYFEADETLKKKYNQTEVNNAITKLDSIPLKITSESILIKKMKENLAAYKMCHDELIITLEKIIQLDFTKPSVSARTDKIKRQEILAEISDYIYNYSINPVDFPFITNLIFDVINKKQINPNADLSSILKEIKY